MTGRTYEQLGALCRENGITHLLVKAGDAGNAWAQFAPCVKPLQAAGVRVYGWTYVYGDDPAGETRVALQALAAEPDGLVLDIEAEAEGKHAAIESLWRGLRAEYPDAWIAHAPLPVVDYHDVDLYRIACRYASAHLPQLYWRALGTYWGDFDRLFGLWARWAAQWRAEGLPDLPIMPIGQAYGPAMPEEMREFVRRCREAGYPAVSWWEWAGASSQQWETVAELARDWLFAPQGV